MTTPLTQEAETLFRRDYSNLVRHACRLGLHPEEAEDVVQAAFVEVLQSKQSIPLTHLPGILRRILRNRIVNRAVRGPRRLHYERESALVAPQRPQLEAAFFAAERDALIDRWWTELATDPELTPRRLRLLQLYYQKGCSLDEIKQETGHSATQIRRDLEVARRVAAARARALGLSLEEV